MKQSKYSKWTLSIGALGGFVGISIHHLFDFDLSGFLGGLTAAVLLVIVNLILVIRKSDKTPAIDERIVQNIRNYYFYVFLVFTGVALISFIILMILNIEVIPVTTLFMVFMMYFVLSGIGAILIGRK